MQAIEVKFLGATNNKPDRLKAFCNAGSITIDTYTISVALLERLGMPINEYNRSWYIALQLRKKLGWTEELYGKMICGTIKNGHDVWVISKEIK